MARISTADSTEVPVARRLRDALLRMTADDSDVPPTVKALCESAGVSRTALYRYHPDILIEVQRLQVRRQRRPNPSMLELQQLRADNQNLRQELCMVAALVDHYFAAWQECQTLVDRRDRELAELRRGLADKPVLLRHK